MRILLFVLFVSVAANLNAQNCERNFVNWSGIMIHGKKLPIGKGLTEYYKGEIIKNYNCLDSPNITDEEKSKVAINTAAIYYYYTLKTDSVKKYLKLAFNYDQEWFQYHLVFVEEQVFSSSYIKNNSREYFLKDKKLKKELPKLFAFEKTKYLERIYNKKNKKKRVASGNIEYTTELKNIKESDQEYRKREHILSEKQNKNDLKNRKKLDALYSLYGFPTIEKVGSDQLLTPWLVLQHSTDCEWNEKWLMRYLEAYKNEQLEVGLLPYTFERFYKPDTGYCRTKDEESASRFIHFLFENYPKEYAEIFGYEDYLIN